MNVKARSTSAKWGQSRPIFAVIIFWSLFAYMVLDFFFLIKKCPPCPILCPFYFSIWLVPALITASLRQWVGWEFFLLIMIVLPVRGQGDSVNPHSDILRIKIWQWGDVITSPLFSSLEFFAKAKAVTFFNTCIFNNQSSIITFLEYSIELSNSNFLLEDRLLNNVVYIQSLRSHKLKI